MLGQHEDWVREIALDPDRKRVWLRLARTVLYTHLEFARPPLKPQTLPGHPDGADTVAFSRDGSLSGERRTG